MRFGLCTKVDNLKKLEAAGYDYIEFRADHVAALSEPEFERVRRAAADSPLWCEALNFFFPPELKVVGPNIDQAQIAAYIERAVRRSAALGAKLLVVGSGKSRFVPEGWSKESGRSQFAAAVKAVGKAAAGAGIMVTIEAIRSSSTNLINNLKEAAGLCEEVAEPNVYIMADYNQMAGENEGMDQIVQYGKYIRHLHLIDTRNSYFPLDPGDPGQRRFFAAVREIDYQGRLSVEIHDFESTADAGRSLAVLKELANQ
jgi:sugar phosphate isomerase/epimerase